ncbi:MTH865 family protein [Halalkaliarchaeum sp. AArc-GB]|uniref:MTH865 family protein n=1 Tax=Halalkaliarchaeum sp. AArc-GB TaxID=3074078 RepID=UPI00285E79C5|nr:MTH865 family protein [Halalkaliarchaeum sp. AArc-GB]MDR5672124.1 MTH865 family protein [Halalkaliarchaeum sp. AArc-GB]
MADVESQLREQFIEAFEGADYPVNNQMDLVPALPDGPGTKFEAGDVTLSAMELASKLGDHQEFPYDDVEGLVDDIIAGLKSEDVI